MRALLVSAPWRLLESGKPLNILKCLKRNFKIQQVPYLAAKGFSGFSEGTFRGGGGIKLGRRGGPPGGPPGGPCWAPGGPVGGLNPGGGGGLG